MEFKLASLRHAPPSPLLKLKQSASEVINRWVCTQLAFGIAELMTPKAGQPITRMAMQDRANPT